MDKYNIGDCVKYWTDISSGLGLVDYKYHLGIIESVHRWTDKDGDKIEYKLSDGADISLIQIEGVLEVK